VLKLRPTKTSLTEALDAESLRSNKSQGHLLFRRLMFTVAEMFVVIMAELYR
jgi:hypothetical protein